MEMLSTVMNKGNLSCYQAIAKGYATGDFSDFIPRLTEETVFESQWVLSHLKGKGEIADYLLGKGETLKKCGLEIKADVVRCNNGVGGVVVIQKRKDGSIKRAVKLLIEIGQLRNY